MRKVVKLNVQWFDRSRGPVTEFFDSQIEYENFLNKKLRDHSQYKILDIIEETFDNVPDNLKEAAAAFAIWWIDGLLNTNHLQAQNQLGDEITGFCCLGYGCYSLAINYPSADPSSLELQQKILLQSETGNPRENDALMYYLENKLGTVQSELVSINDNVFDGTFNEIGRILSEFPECYFHPEVASIIKKHYGNKNMV